MFIGQYQYSIDDKGRLVIPQEYRKELGSTIVIGKGADECITIYPVKVWEEFMEKLSNLPINQVIHRAYTRLNSAFAFYRDFDSQGRIKIDDCLKSHAKIKKQCVVIGANKVVEIWSQESWDEIEASSGEQLLDISEKIVF